MTIAKPIGTYGAFITANALANPKRSTMFVPFRGWSQDCKAIKSLTDHCNYCTTEWNP